MYHLRAHAPDERVEALTAMLVSSPGVWHVATRAMADGESTELTADIDPRIADDVLDRLTAAGVSHDDVVVARLDEVGPVGAPTREGPAGLLWAALVGDARTNSWIAARYLVFMVTAGVVAAFGVIDNNAILIVGAMALSPDLLPVSAACVGLVLGRRRLVGRAIATLGVGLFATTAVSFLLTWVLLAIGWLPSGFDPSMSAIGVLVSIDLSSVVVAAAAGIAAMLAFETRANAAVGVAISVTTIPAAAYAGVAGALGLGSQAWGALAVLLLNVIVLLIAGTATLAIQRLGTGSSRTPSTFLAPDGQRSERPRS